MPKITVVVLRRYESRRATEGGHRKSVFELAGCREPQRGRAKEQVSAPVRAARYGSDLRKEVRSGELSWVFTRRKGGRRERRVSRCAPAFCLWPSSMPDDLLRRARLCMGTRDWGTRDERDWSLRGSQRIRLRRDRVRSQNLQSRATGANQGTCHSGCQ